MYNAFLQVVDYLIRQGMYVNVDFHSIGFHKTMITGETPFSGADDYSLYDIHGWTQLWRVTHSSEHRASSMPSWHSVATHRLLGSSACLLQIPSMLGRPIWPRQQLGAPGLSYS